MLYMIYYNLSLIQNTFKMIKMIRKIRSKNCWNKKRYYDMIICDCDGKVSAPYIFTESDFFRFIL